MVRGTLPTPGAGPAAAHPRTLRNRPPGVLHPAAMPPPPAPVGPTGSRLRGPPRRHARRAGIQAALPHRQFVRSPDIPLIDDPPPSAVTRAQASPGRRRRANRTASLRQRPPGPTAPPAHTRQCAPLLYARRNRRQSEVRCTPDDDHQPARLGRTKTPPHCRLQVAGWTNQNGSRDQNSIRERPLTTNASDDGRLGPPLHQGRSKSTAVYNSNRDRSRRDSMPPTGL